MHRKCKLWIYGRNQTAYLSTLPALHHLRPTPSAALIKPGGQAGVTDHARLQQVLRLQPLLPVHASSHQWLEDAASRAGLVIAPTEI